jgi:hypothetical protein
MEIDAYLLPLVIILTTFNIQLCEFCSVSTLKSGSNRQSHFSFQHLDLLVFLKRSGNTTKKKNDTSSVNVKVVDVCFIDLLLSIQQIFLAKSCQ